MSPQPDPLFWPWLSKISPALRGTQWGLLSDLALAPRGSVPDFLCPPPSTPLPTLREELETVRSVPGDVVRAEIGIVYNSGVPSSLRSAMETPSELLQKVAALIEQFWSTAMAPDWMLMQARLEVELLSRSRDLTLGGLEGLFGRLHHHVVLREGCLTVRSMGHWDDRLREGGLLLIPSVFSWPDVSLTMRLPWRRAMVYPCRGIADLWDDTSRPSPGGLQELLGGTCARIISRLQVPGTTLGTATALGLSTAATSEQITKLWKAGVLDRARIGRRVFYSLNQRGTALFTAFGKNPPRPLPPPSFSLPLSNRIS